MSSGETYRVRENTDCTAHPSIDDVIELTLERAASPRPEDHPDGHLDYCVHDAVDEYGENTVAECIRLTLVEGLTHRSAGATAFGEDDYQQGINVGVACSAYLRELLGEKTVDS